MCYANKLLLKIRAACHRSQPREERAVSLSPTHPHLQGVGRGEELEGERSHMAEDLMGLKKPPQKPKRKRLGELRAGAQSSAAPCPALCTAPVWFFPSYVLFQ